MSGACWIITSFFPIFQRSPPFPISDRTSFPMRLSTGFVPTVKETPADAVIPSHQLMIRAGMIRALAAGVYAFLPLGLRALNKAAAIGGQEFHLPALSPVELWEQTGRVKAFGDTLFHLKNRPLVLAPTHEEVICWLAKNHISSYKAMPQIWYQIQTKFRNEPRPRSGVIRGRQFLMKDSYSLDRSWEGLDHAYTLHAEAYKKIFTRCGLRFFVVGASSGAMGGTGSQEFMMESDAGEDVIALSADGRYAANVEVASSDVPKGVRHSENPPVEEIHTPGVKTIDELVAFLKVDEARLAKSVVYWGGEKPILVLMMGNDELNEAKLGSVLGLDVHPMEAERLLALTGADGGSIGPVGLKGFTILADKRLEGANGLISGAKAPNGGGPLRIVKGIELGHIFKLGTKYADALHATFLDENGKEASIIMGSYGIGIERIVACHIEQNHDANGIIWDKALAPFDLHVIGVAMKSQAVADAAESIYEELQADGFDVLFDDRKDISPGFKFKDADLLGMPLQVIIGEKNLAAGKIEIKNRRSGERTLVDRGNLAATIRSFLS
jgi:prolyl-tRNA synthetase